MLMAAPEGQAWRGGHGGWKTGKSIPRQIYESGVLPGMLLSINLYGTGYRFAKKGWYVH
ncbi:hypothetical protein KDH_13050 [Dictyobacter sp. S3.2.2.5]|uniref:Uncharacterized protein n=1 Tax=Dictyobacter halimunensis TaxID=3026934 RepID=A0ABQ6FPU9_9CHLR|nr:hypothetical protein KDH_13050 [Dictyobacter sp. S3.2.2.5]